MSNHEWRDASVTPCPTGVLVQITYRARGTPLFCTGQGVLRDDMLLDELDGAGLTCVRGVIAWRYPVEPDIPVMTPTTVLRGGWWVNYALQRCEFCASVWPNSDGYGWRWKVQWLGKTINAPSFAKTLDQAMEAAERLIHNTMDDGR
jgi:hypothetical protein